MSIAVQLIENVGNVVAQFGNPDAAPPPGVGTKFSTILGWVKYLAIFVLIVSLIAVGATMATQHRHGDGAMAGGKLMSVAAGAVIVSAATTMITFLVA